MAREIKQLKNILIAPQTLCNGELLKEAMIMKMGMIKA